MKTSKRLNQCLSTDGSRPDTGSWKNLNGSTLYNNKIEYMLRLYQMASISEVVPVSTVTLVVLIYTCLNNNNQYEA